MDTWGKNGTFGKMDCDKLESGTAENNHTLYHSFGRIKGCKLDHGNYSIHMTDAIFQIAK
jgi:hypothetical protein